MLLSACTPGEEDLSGLERPSIALSPTSMSMDWSVRFSVSGGFAGLNRQLVISSDGAASATDRKSNRQAALQLTDSELTSLGELVLAVKPPQTTGSLPACADCFVYELGLRPMD